MQEDGIRLALEHGATLEQIASHLGLAVRQVRHVLDAPRPPFRVRDDADEGITMSDRGAA